MVGVWGISYQHDWRLAWAFQSPMKQRVLRMGYGLIEGAARWHLLEAMVVYAGLQGSVIGLFSPVFHLL